jgi:hypothetical protein
MATNRKNKSAAVRWGPAIYALLICLFVGGSSLGYVWQKNQIDSLGRQIKESEVRLNELRQINKQRGNTLAYMRSPLVLDARVKEMNLGLVQPHPDQILRLYEPVVENRPAVAAPAIQQMAARPPGVAIR